VIRENMSILTIENGNRVWRNEAGQIHREDGPAVEYANGTKVWYINNLRHREDGPAIEDKSGAREWWFNNKLHRETGPARITEDGSKVWYIRGTMHRKDGPAIETARGSCGFCVRGKDLSKEEFINLLVQHDLKLQLLNQVLPPGSETLVDKYYF
jgi:hypothetical protein